jgi:hypothetical protein
MMAEIVMTGQLRMLLTLSAQPSGQLFRGTMLIRCSFGKGDTTPIRNQGRNLKNKLDNYDEGSSDW